jgi:HD-GYP domain-containing protein (c-di-GMP phosphodiesterase class II)
MNRARLRQFQEISALLNSTFRYDEIRARAIEAATVLLEAEAGSLLLQDPATGELRFDVAHGTGSESVKQVRLRRGEGIAGYVMKTGEPTIINDVQKDTRFFNKADRRSGFTTRSMVCVPVTAHGARLGVLQVLNKTRGRLFDEDDLQNCVALGHQVGIAVENANLYQSIQNLFDGFVSASVQAIESRDPATSGHSVRVATLSCRLAEAVTRHRRGPYAHTTFDEHQLKELHYAAVLHDFGKVGVRERVLVKARKLYPGEFALLRSRFDFIKRTLELEHTRRQVECLRSKSRPEADAAIAELDRDLSARLLEIDRLFSRIEQHNQPDLAPLEEVKRLEDIAALQYESYEGARPYLTAEEIAALSIPIGSLTGGERKEIETHVTHTFEFLTKIPWTGTLKYVPWIAYNHHEYLDGTGYPRGVTGSAIPVQARIMTICDIFDALTAADRPYKGAIAAATALDILELKATRGQIDPALFELFLSEKIYESTGTGSALRKTAQGWS